MYVYIYHTIIPQISVLLSFNFPGNRSHDELRARPMRLFFLSLYGCGQVIQLNDFVWVFASRHRQRRCGIPPTVSQEKFIPQLIARMGYRLTKNYIGYPKRYTKLRLTPIYNQRTAFLNIVWHFCCSFDCHSIALLVLSYLAYGYAYATQDHVQVAMFYSIAQAYASPLRLPRIFCKT